MVKAEVPKDATGAVARDIRWRQLYLAAGASRRALHFHSACRLDFSDEVRCPSAHSSCQRDLVVPEERAGGGNRDVSRWA